MSRQLPNQLTVARIVLAIVFFVLLGLYEQGASWGRWLLNAAFVLYIVAGITDILDGWIARKYDSTSTFGRLVDPVVDKVLVVGTFVMLAGSNFAGSTSDFERSLPAWLTGHMSSCVQAWMVVCILTREFVVSAVRAFSEAKGKKFPATYAGKIKMFIQSVAICVVLYQLANVRTPPWAVILKIAMVWLAVAATVLSGVAYLSKARRLLTGDE